MPSSEIDGLVSTLDGLIDGVLGQSTSAAAEEDINLLLKNS
jgi:hypothetical protein